MAGVEYKSPSMWVRFASSRLLSADAIRSVLLKSVAATAAATGSAFYLFLLIRSFSGVPYDWVNIAEVLIIPVLVGFPITIIIFYQNAKLIDARVALAQQTYDNERHRMLLDELNHRVKNTLATVLALSTQTARGTQDVASFVQNFRGRILALAASHDILLRQGWTSVSLDELAAEVLRPFTGSITMEGRSIDLGPAAAISLALVLHELATNAAKYGALSGDGRVSIRWRFDRELRLEWVEEGGPIVMPPGGTGFGTRLIHQIVEAELGGSWETDFHPGGLRCQITVPAEKL